MIRKMLTAAGGAIYPNLFERANGTYYHLSPEGKKTDVSPLNMLNPNDKSTWTFTGPNGEVYSKIKESTNQGEITPAEDVNPVVRSINNYFREYNWRKLHPEEGVISGKYTLPLIGLTATGVGALASAPVTFGVSALGAYTGGKTVDAGSKLFTGRTWAENMRNWTGLDEEPANWTNPGMWVGAGLGNKALNAAKLRVLDVAYDNFTPLGYTDVPGLKFNHKLELKNMAKDFFSFKKIDTSPLTYPKWYTRIMKEDLDALNNTSFGDISLGNVVRYRDEAWRLATNQKPRLGLYKPNGDGTYRYDMNIVENIEGGPKIRDFFVKPTSDLNTVIANDMITSNGGFVSMKLGPHNVSNRGFYAGTLYAGRPSFTITDVWDLQPFTNESRTFLPWLTKLGTDHPRMFGWAKNMEVLKPLGGNPFTLKLTFPEGTARIHIQPNKTLPK